MQNRIIRTLLLTATLCSVGEGMLGPMLSLFTQKIGGSPLDLAASWALYLIITGACMIFVGHCIDHKYSPEWLLVVGYLLNALCTFGYLWVSDPIHLFIVQAGLGAANALATPSWDTLFARHTPTERNGTLWGTANGQEQMISGVAILLGSSIIYYTSFSVLFVLMGVIQLLATLVQAQLLQTSYKLKVLGYVQG